MVNRSEPFLTTDSLTVRLVSTEDIFLFKLIAGRDDDIEDMSVLVETGLDYDVVGTELEVQIEQLGDDQFATFANEALLDLEERYGVTMPIGDRVEELATRYYRGLEVFQVLDEPKSIETVADELGLDVTVVRERITYLEVFDRVTREDETVRQAKNETE